jgi:hypothetical protein
VAAIFYQTGYGVGLVPKELEGGAFDAFEEFVFVTGEAVLCGVVFEQRGTLGWLLGDGLTLGRGLRALLGRLRTLQEFGN